MAELTIIAASTGTGAQFMAEYLSGWKCQTAFEQNIFIFSIYIYYKYYIFDTVPLIEIK